jgi:hypothetical protein
MVMVTLARTYVKAMWDNQSLLATWHPDVQLSVGDIVTAGPGGLVERETGFADVRGAGGALSVSTHPAARVVDHHGVILQATAQAAASRAATARASFSSESSFLIVTQTGEQDRVSSLAEARAAVEELIEEGVWKPGWHLVTTVRRYPACTLIIAKGGGVEAVLDVNTDLGAATPASVYAGASVSVDTARASHWSMSFESTPLYEAIGVRRRGVLRREDVRHVEYLKRERRGVAEDVAGSENEWVVQMSSPSDLGLL